MPGGCSHLVKPTLAPFEGVTSLFHSLSRAGKHLATGSDDKMACLYELKGGPGQTTFGTSDGPNVENWKLSVSLRGHSSHVTDLAWSVEDTFLATCGWVLWCLIIAYSHTAASQGVCAKLKGRRNTLVAHKGICRGL